MLTGAAANDQAHIGQGVVLYGNPAELLGGVVLTPNSVIGAGSSAFPIAFKKPYHPTTPRLPSIILELHYKSLFHLHSRYSHHGQSW